MRLPLNIFYPGGMGKKFKDQLHRLFNQFFSYPNFDTQVYATSLGIEVYQIWLTDAELDNIPEIMLGIPKELLEEYETGIISHREFIQILEIYRRLMAKIPNINFNSTDKRKEIIEYYIEIFSEIPSMAHLVRCYAQMERQITEMVSRSEISLTPELEKSISKFDKMKNLALNNANINERKVAFAASTRAFERITGIKLVTETK